MTYATVSPARLEKAVVEVAAEVARLRSSGQANVNSEEALFFELISCILGSQVSFELASAFARQLRCSPVYRSLLFPNSNPRTAALLRHLLALPISDPTSSCHGKRYRFWRTKAKCIAQASVAINGILGGLKSMLSTMDCEQGKRKTLADVVAGIGPKQASLFLRNVGHARNLAVLDAHVLNYMRELGIISARPRNLGLLKVYEDIEATLIRYGNALGHPLNYLDEAIWVVMRVRARL
jgi:N-glycosylase/DNA lyase